MGIQEEKLESIANAIREKDGTSAPIVANEFPDRIRAIQPGVKSFNGRTGDVMPAAGDYTAEQIGALPLSGGVLDSPGILSLNALEFNAMVGDYFILVSTDSDELGTLAIGVDTSGAFHLGLQPTRITNILTPEYDSDAATKEYVDSKASGIPSGVIVMWSGAANAIPTGWALCNGSNGTPDLRNRFIVGAGSSYSVGAMGGADTVTLTVEQMPSHSHQNSAGTVQNTAHYTPITSGSGEVLVDISFSSYVGGNSGHENRPPYYALCFIMKK